MYGKALNTPGLAIVKEFTGAERALMPPPVSVKTGKAKRVNHSTELTYTHSKAPVVLNTVGEGVWTNTFSGNRNSSSSSLVRMHHNWSVQCRSGIRSWLAPEKKNFFRKKQTKLLIKYTKYH